ncbi:unnamed protein product [Polarella glacialis]|uniref:AB hydrolase-1 domain-containing protein n=1 Tax=Polarella glacialis TaxID=89957 RepID=A0A813LV84_POLGL|nr:unnamed protein product [Polarella glacialis]
MYTTPLTEQAAKMASWRTGMARRYVFGPFRSEVRSLGLNRPLAPIVHLAACAASSATSRGASSRAAVVRRSEASAPTGAASADVRFGALAVAAGLTASLTGGLGFAHHVHCASTADSFVHQLADGRQLCYHVEGSGTPVFAFHGMGSSRLTWVGSQRLSEVAPGIRLIAVDRPGYGNSSQPPPGYSYAAFVKDLAELADHLGHARFCVAGHSSGGPYALAAAALLPERVVACAAISSDPPYSHPSTPQEVRMADSMSHPAQMSSGGLYGQDPMEQTAKYRSKSMASGDARKCYAWKQGVLGWLCDFTLERIPWSFALEDIALGPRLTFWAGEEDFEAISLGACFMQTLVPGSKLHVVAGGNHGFKSEPVHLASIFKELQVHWQSLER